MNKIYQRIDWENYPSSATPLNEDNLNKMDYAIDKLDDRIVTHETTKLNTATGNTLVKNVTFNEKTGVFTIEKLSGSKITINTALEKISTNFHFNPTTQKLVLTLIDGTVQEIDLSALITQYEFLESDTITFEIDANGKIKANILNGSITGEKLEPNYLANVTLQAKNAKTSADNAKTSEELAYQYAEEAKESASQTAKSDAKNITYDNTESGLSATNVKDALDEVAQCSVSAIATDTTITDSTNAPLVRLKVKGKTEQFTTSGKNLCSSNNFTVTAPANGTQQSNYAYKSINIHNKITSNKTYIFSADIKKLVGSPSEISIVFMDEALSTGTEIKTGTITNNHVEISISIGNASVYYLLVYAGKQGSTAGNSVEFSNVMLRESTTDSTYEPYTGGVASPNPDYPQEINGLAKDGAIEVKTCGKNLCDNNNFTVIAPSSGTPQSYYAFKEINIAGKLKANKTYTMTADVKILAGSPTGISIAFSNEDLIYGTEYKTGAITNNHVEVSMKLGGNTSNFYYLLIYAGVKGSTAGNSIEFSNVMLRESTTDATYEPYTETTAIIPTDAPLYEGDYLEVYADGSGKLVRENYRLSENFTVNKLYNKAAGIELPYYGRNASKQNYSNYFLNGTGFENGKMALGEHEVGAYSHAYIKIEGLTTFEEYLTWINNHPDLEIVYKLTTPTETPLTAEQVEQFKKLYTFEPVTNVLCDGETEIQYYKNTSSGVAMATVHKKTLLVENTTVDVFTDTLGEWNSISINDDVTLRGITYGNGKLVAVGDDGAVYYSEDNGETWSTANASQTMYSVTYGNGLFVAVSADDFCTSPDGITWTVRKEVGDVLYSVTYGGDKKLFVAFGTEYADGNYTLHNYYSPDGINWYSAEIGYFTEAYCNVKYIPEDGIFLGVCGVHTFSSSDGISFSAIGVCESTSKLQSITCGNGMYVAIDDNGDIFYNANPTSVSIWTRGASLGVALYDVIFKNGLFIAVGAIRATYYSEYGMSWNSFGTGVTGSGDLYSITYNHGKFIAVGGNGSIFAVEYSKESKNLQDAINELYLQLK